MGHDDRVGKLLRLLFMIGFGYGIVLLIDVAFEALFLYLAQLTNLIWLKEPIYKYIGMTVICGLVLVVGRKKGIIADLIDALNFK